MSTKTEKTLEPKEPAGILEKLMNIQQELKAPKDKENDFGNYKYRSAEQILEAVKPLLLKNRCVLVIRDEIETRATIANARYYVKAHAELRCIDTAQSVYATAYAREADSQKGKDESQITGTSSSYARKYALNGLFGIDDTKDADTNEHRKEQEARAKAQTTQKKTTNPEEASDEDRLDLIARCRGKNVAPEEVLEKIGWSADHKMTRKEYEAAVKYIEELK